jgi:A/G-specific adenine glycosylase
MVIAAPQPPLSRLAKPLLAWYDTVRACRNMPWRKSRDPYAIWLSEIMLQQTQVETVKPFFPRFLERFPTIADLASAPLQNVLALWSGLGYYRRAKHLHQAAQQVVARYGGVLPADWRHLRTLPGVGRYTAGAIASIAFNLPTPAVDGNVIRVLARLTACRRDIAQPKNHEFFWQTAAAILRGVPHASSTTYGDANQALMELGATVCLPPPARPACPQCPIRRFCRARAAGRQLHFPVKSRRRTTPLVRGAALVLLRKNHTRVLLLQRPSGGLWEGMWEFPVLSGPSAATRCQALAKTYGASSSIPCGTVRHQLSHRALCYRVFSAVAPGAGFRRPLPLCAGAGRPYTAARWVRWPLNATGSLPIARIVHKIAAAAASASPSASRTGAPG